MMTRHLAYPFRHISSKELYEKLDKDVGRRRFLKQDVPRKAAEIKKQIDIENRFHAAMEEIQTTTDADRRSYLHWILSQMFSRFDYESALHAINDDNTYRAWLYDNHQVTARHH